MDTEKKSSLKIFKEVFYKNLRLFHLMFLAIFFLIILLLSTTTNAPCDYEESDLYISDLKGQIVTLEGEITALREQVDLANSPWIFGEPFNFDSAVTGYFKKITEPVYNPEQEAGDTRNETLDKAYFVITGYQENEEMKNYLKALEEGNVNKKENGNILFALGCYENNTIKIDVDDDEEYIDSATMTKILNSTIEKPINLRLFFQNELGIGCECCKLAYKIRAE